MAVTFTKPLRTIVITTIGGGEFSVADTVDAAAASNALGQFEAHGTMVFTVTVDEAEAEVQVPFHAVDHITITVETSEEQSRPDPVCKEEEGEP